MNAIRIRLLSLDECRQENEAARRHITDRLLSAIEERDKLLRRILNDYYSELTDASRDDIIKVLEETP